MAIINKRNFPTCYHNGKLILEKTYFFQKYVNELLTKDDFQKLGIGHRIYGNSAKAYLTAEQRDKHSRTTRSIGAKGNKKGTHPPTILIPKEELYILLNDPLVKKKDILKKYNCSESMLEHNVRYHELDHKTFRLSTSLNSKDLEIIELLSRLDPTLIKVLDSNYYVHNKEELALKLYKMYRELLGLLVWTKDRIYRLRKSLKNVGINITELKVIMGRSSLELTIFDWLEDKKIDFVPNYQIGFEGKKFFYDILVPPNYIIEVDGYMHKRDDVKLKDQLKNKIAKGFNYNLLRITEDEIDSNTFEDKILCFLKMK